MTRCDHPRS